MPPTPELLERTIALKHELIEFTNDRRFRAEVDRELAEFSDGRRALGDNELIFAMDRLLLQHEYSNGRTLVEAFVEAHRELPESERQMLLAWRDVHEGVFRIDQIDDGRLTLFNLVNDLTFDAYSNAGVDFVASLEPDSYLMARLVPLGGDWLFSGGVVPISVADRHRAIELAVRMATTMPRVVFQNPVKLEQAWEAQRRERQDFIRFFGADTVILPPKHMQRRLNDYMRWLSEERRAGSGLANAGPPPMFSLPKTFDRCQTIGAIYDDIDGLNFFPDYGLIVELFEDPSLAADEEHGEALTGYVESDGVIPLPIQRAAERDPEKASLVIRELFGEDDFEWTRDGADWLRDYKSNYYTKPPQPGVSPISEELSLAHREASQHRRVGRNDPCPCGSGKKYKHCHGRTATHR